MIDITWLTNLSHAPLTLRGSKGTFFWLVKLCELRSSLRETAGGQRSIPSCLYLHFSSESQLTPQACENNSIIFHDVLQFRRASVWRTSCALRYVQRCCNSETWGWFREMASCLGQNLVQNPRRCMHSHSHRSSIRSPCTGGQDWNDSSLGTPRSRLTRCE